MKTTNKNLNYTGVSAKPAKVLLFLCISIFFAMFSCKDIQTVTPNSPLTINTNASDPLIAFVEKTDASLTEFYGVKNSKGIAERIDRIVYRENVKSKESSSLNLDEKSRLKSIFTTDGNKYFLNWQSDSKATLTYVSGNGETQFNTEIDLNAPDEPKTQSFEIPQTFSTDNLSVRRGEDIMLKQVQTPNIDVSSPRQSFQQSTTMKELKVNVTQCNGLPVDADQVTVIMYKDPGGLSTQRIGEYTGKRIARGLYSVILPSDQATKVEIDYQEACKVVSELANTVLCSKTAKVLRKIAKVSKITPVTFAVGVLAEEALEKTCELVAGAAANNTCESKFESKLSTIYTGDISFLASVVPASGGKVKYFPQVIISGKSTQYPDLKAELGGEAKVNTMTLTPDRPLAKQAYHAVASIYCLPFNSIVTMSVIGTDGYKNSKSLTVNNLDNTGAFSISLYVPGAASGIKDEILLKATLPDGKIINRNVSLVFQ
jgi:hypothetical protein